MRVLVWMLRLLKDLMIKLWIAELLALGIAYVIWSERAEGPYTTTHFVIDLVTTLKELGVPGLPDVPGLDMLPAGAPSGESGARTVTFAASLPLAPDGWTRRSWSAADAAAIVAAGAALPPEAHADAVRVMLAFENVLRGETPGHVETYAQGEDRVVVMIRQGAGEGAIAATEGVPLAVHGVEFAPMGPPAPEAALSGLSARIAGEIAVDAVSTAGMEALVAVLSGLDVAGLNGLAATPDPRVSSAKGVKLAPGLAAPAVTRGQVQPFDLVGGAADGAEEEAEAAPTGVCVRRAGVRVCE